MSWQPIETAPKDGTEVLVYAEGCGVLLARLIAMDEYLTESELEWYDGILSDEQLNESDWFVADFVSGSRLEEKPTHWQPLPPPPNED